MSSSATSTLEIPPPFPFRRFPFRRTQGRQARQDGRICKVPYVSNQVPNAQTGGSMRVEMTVNGARYAHDVEPRVLLVQFIREHAGLTGTNVGCDTTSCGTCTVLLDGESVKSCNVLAAQADGAAITTIEEIATGSNLHPMQDALRENHAL